MNRLKFMETQPGQQQQFPASSSPDITLPAENPNANPQSIQGLLASTPRTIPGASTSGYSLEMAHDPITIPGVYGPDITATPLTRSQGQAEALQQLIQKMRVEAMGKGMADQASEAAKAPYAIHSLAPGSLGILGLGTNNQSTIAGPPKEVNPTEWSLAMEAAGGDAKKALDIVTQNHIKETDARTSGTDALAVQSITPADPTSQNILAATGLSGPAFEYLTKGTPGLARMSEKTRIKYINEGTNYLKKTGKDYATFRSEYGAVSKTVEANALRNNQAQVAEMELNATLENIRSAADEASFKSLRWRNVAKMLAGQLVNDPALEKYGFHLEQLREEFAMYNAALSGQIDTNGNIREITNSDRERANNIIRDGFAKGSLVGFENALRASREKMAKVLERSISIQNDRVWSLFGLKKPKSEDPQDKQIQDLRSKYNY
jgi:hypothetical protein